MSLKSALDLAMERSDRIVEPQDIIKLTAEQKESIDHIRTHYQAKIAETEIMARSRIQALSPEEASEHRHQFENEIQAMRRQYSEEMEFKIAQKMEEFKADQ